MLLRKNQSLAVVSGFSEPSAKLRGFNFWLNKLNSSGGDFRRAEMVKAFLSSTEYRQRFGQP
jgi:hypothetical protein